MNNSNAHIQRQINFRNIMIMFIILIVIIVILFALLIYFNYNSLVPSSRSSSNNRNSEQVSESESEPELRVVEPKEVTLDTFLYDAVIRMSDSDIEDIEKAVFDNEKVKKLIKDRFIKKTEKKASFYYNRVYNTTKSRMRVKNYLDGLIGNMKNGDHNKIKQIIGHNEIVESGVNLNNVSIFIDKILKELATNQRKYLKDQN